MNTSARPRVLKARVFQLLDRTFLSSRRFQNRLVNLRRRYDEDDYEDDDEGEEAGSHGAKKHKKVGWV